MFLRQSTSQVILFGPCLDMTDMVTEEVVLTLAQADMRLSKDGGAFAQKNASGNATHDSDGWYSTTLDATDTATVGELILNVHQPANMLPVQVRFTVVEEAVYDALYAASADIATVVNASIVTYGLDHLVAVADADDVVDDSIIAKLASAEATANWSDFVNTTDSLEALRERGDLFWQTGWSANNSGTIVGASGASAARLSAGSTTNDLYNGQQIIITSGTGAGQCRIITDYNGATKDVTISPDWTTDPVSLDTYEIYPASVNLTTIENVDATDQINTEVDNALDTAIPGSPTASSINEAIKRLARSVGVVQEFTVDTDVFTSTTTQAQVDAVDIDSLEATDDHYVGRVIVFTSGVLKHEATDITDYDGTNKRFTFTALTSAPANNVTFIVV